MLGGPDHTTRPADAASETRRRKRIHICLNSEQAVYLRKRPFHEQLSSGYPHQVHKVFARRAQAIPNVIHSPIWHEFSLLISSSGHGSDSVIEGQLVSGRRYNEWVRSGHFGC